MKNADALDNVSNPKIEDVGAGSSCRSQFYWRQELSFALQLKEHISFHVYLNAIMLFWMGQTIDWIAIAIGITEDGSL